MPSRQLYSNDIKLRIIELLKEGNAQKKVANMIGCSQSTISDLKKKYEETGSVINRKKCGRPRATCKRDDRKLRNIVKNTRRLTSKQINIIWEQNVSNRTVRNRLNEMGFAFRKAKMKPFLTKRHKRERLQWCRDHANWTVTDWYKVIFSDESRVCVGTGDDAGKFVWRRPNEKFDKDCLNFKKKYPESYMIWSCMTEKGVGKLCILYQNVNSESYIHILENFLIPSIEVWFEDSPNFIFQDDNASCHRSKAVKDYLRHNGIKTMYWPANSPDLNPIENLWAKVKLLINEKKPTNKEDLRHAIRQSWEEISPTNCKDLIESMPKRIKEVIRKRGAATKY